MVAKEVAQLGRGANLAKIDIKSAYRIVSVNPESYAFVNAVERENIPRYQAAIWAAVSTNNIYDTSRCP